MTSLEKDKMILQRKQFKFGKIKSLLQGFFNYILIKYNYDIIKATRCFYGGVLMAKYRFDGVNYKSGLDDIEIPKFQRGLVWSNAKKEALLRTIHNGFPFGSLLVSESKNSIGSSMLLLDGQQRLSTIKEYEQNKFNYWIKLNPDKFKNLKKNINELIKNKDFFVDDNKLVEISKDNYDLGSWTDELDDLNLTKETKGKLRKLVNEAKNEVNNYINLNELQIPLTIYTGEPEFLPEVFENLNKGGVPLSKYEVFNASWNDAYLSLPESEESNEILNNVKNYYLSLQEKGEFDISEFSEDEITSSRRVNLAEFARAYGKFTVDKLPSLFNKRDEKSINEIGYGLLAIVCGVPNSKISSLKDEISVIDGSVNEILEKTDTIANKINGVFSKILQQIISYDKNRNSKKGGYSTGLTSSFKVLSYFANLWEANSEESIRILTNLPSYYVFDSLNNSWTAHGDSRLNDYYPNEGKRNYSTPLSRESFIQSFKSWIEDNPGNRKTFSKEIKALITIHSNYTYMSSKVPTGEAFEFEHIIPKAWIVDNGSTSQPTRLSSLGNGMLLPKSTNNKKKDHTLYEFNNYDESVYDEFITESNYPSIVTLQEARRASNSNEFDKINEIIDNRSIEVIESIADNILKKD